VVVPTRSARLKPIEGENGQAGAPTLSPERIASVLFASGEAAYSWNIETDTLAWSANAPAMLGALSAGEVASGRAYTALLDPASPQNRHDIIHGDTQKDGGAGVPYRLRYALKQSAGKAPCWIEDSGRWFAGAEGNPSRADGVIRVVTEEHLREQELTKLSASDPLTGGLNRMVLTKEIEEELENAAKFKTSFGFLIVGIDDLAHFNRSYGFGIGDQAIAAVAERLRSKKRGKDLIGRFSDNKFGILVRECSLDDLAVAGARFINAVREAPFETSVGPLVLSVTAGGVVAPRYARDLGEIIAHAHEALDQAKKAGKGSFAPYRPSIENDQRRRENLRITDLIVAALNDRRIAVAKQPIVSAQDRKPAFYECLVRLSDAQGAAVDAKTIVGIAEQLDLVRLIDHRVLELAAAELRTDPALKLSINVSAATLHDSGWVNALDAETQNGFGQRLIVEITESAAIQDVEATRRFVAHVQSRGCKVAIDDFGAGYSSFRNLRTLGVDMVKIDGSFVENLDKVSDDRAFVKALLQLSRELGLETVAEFVQTEAAAEWLKACGCDYLQGALTGLGTMTEASRAKQQRAG
jgi:diguanylate cyclase (GGDEF)-like protein